MDFNFTSQENEAFQELKSRMKEKYGSKEITDFQLYRFLKARNFIVNQAEDMMIKYFQWREKCKVDTILETFKMLEVQEKYFQISLIGHDLGGAPVIFLKFGSVDIKGLLRSEKPSYYQTYIIYFFIGLEKYLREQSEKLGKQIETWNAVLDFENFAFSQVLHKPNVDIALSCLSLYEANFPERLKRAYIINASTTFFIGYNIAKRILSARTLSKITVYGKDGWKEDFLNTFNLEELPAFLGGKKTDPDGNRMCYTTVNHGGTVPEEYYFRSVQRRLSSLVGLRIYDVDRRGKTDVLFEVDKPDSTIEWEFGSKSKDIAFKLCYKRNYESRLPPITLIDTQRVDVHSNVEMGTFLCKKVGTYILTLDNSYSWFKSKRIYCRSSVNPPEEEEAKNHNHIK